jgi:VIT1/CCC1 family predicted Fe2+/Mn2+ transporter
VSVPAHAEQHRSHRSPWLRAAVLGANDGIVSTASLIIGVAAATTSRANVVTAGVAGLVAGAMSMAAGEYISVSSQRDTEQADRELESAALRSNPRGELRELTKIYEDRGLEPALARKVAEQLSEHDVLGAHMRDEIGLTSLARAQPLQAAWTSALSFTVGAVVPLLAATLAPTSARIIVTAVVALLALVGLGALGAAVGGAPLHRAGARVLVWSSLAMAATYGIGRLVGANI